jgi:CheY-like chemotaxis protein
MSKILKKTSDKKYVSKINKLNILIVDDDECTRESLRDIIKMRGHNIVTVDEGLSAINKCKNKEFDIIFMDYHIDDLKKNVGTIDGVDITNMLNECFDMKTNIFAFTGDSSKDAIEKFKNNNMTGALIKPIDGVLIDKIFEMIESSKDYLRNLRKLSIKNKNLLIFKK